MERPNVNTTDMPDRIEALKELAQRATPGPWYVGTTRASGQEVLIDTDSRDPRLRYESWQGLAVFYGCDEQPREGSAVARANAEFAAAASPSTILKLVAVVEKAREMHEALHNANDCIDNDGQPYQSQWAADRAAALEAAFAALDDRETA